MYASLVCVQFMYSTSLGLARQLSYEEKNEKNESQTLGLESPIGDSRQKCSFVPTLETGAIGPRVGEAHPLGAEGPQGAKPP